MKYEDFKQFLRQFAEEYYKDKNGAALAAKHFAKRVRDTTMFFTESQSPDPSEILLEALRKIEQMSDPGSAELAVVDMKAIATEAITKYKQSKT